MPLSPPLRLALLGLTLLATPTWAQVDLADASVPDASVGQGGADQDNEEAEEGVGKTPTRCRSSTDCERGFACEAGRCNYVGFRKADSEGCLIGGATLVIVPLALLVGLRRRRATQPK